MRQSGIMGGVFLLLLEILPLILYGVLLRHMALDAPFKSTYQDYAGSAFWLWLAATSQHALSLMILSLTAGTVTLGAAAGAGDKPVEVAGPRTRMDAPADQQYYPAPGTRVAGTQV